MQVLPKQEVVHVVPAFAAAPLNKVTNVNINAIFFIFFPFVIVSMNQI